MSTDYFVDLLFSTLIPIAFSAFLGVVYLLMKQRRYSTQATHLVVSIFLVTTYLVLTSCSKKVHTHSKPGSAACLLSRLPSRNQPTR